MASLEDEFYQDGLSEDLHTTCVYPTGIQTRKQFVDLMQDLKYVDDGFGFLEKCIIVYFIFTFQHIPHDSVPHSRLRGKRNRWRNVGQQGGNRTKHMGNTVFYFYVPVRKLNLFICTRHNNVFFHGFQNHSQIIDPSSKRRNARKNTCSHSQGLAVLARHTGQILAMISHISTGSHLKFAIIISQTPVIVWSVIRINQRNLYIFTLMWGYDQLHGSVSTWNVRK